MKQPSRIGIGSCTAESWYACLRYRPLSWFAVRRPSICLLLCAACACVRARVRGVCVHAHVRACVRACVRVHVRVHACASACRVPGSAPDRLIRPRLVSTSASPESAEAA